MKRKIIPYHTNLKALARKLRNDSTLSEILLWKELNNKQFYGYDFHRQKPLLNYIVDFYCYELDLVIEIDGLYHNNEDQHFKDLQRDIDLKAHGLRIIRLTELEVKQNMLNVLRTLKAHYQEHKNQQTTNFL